MKHVIIILIASLLFGLQTTGCAANPKTQSIGYSQLDSIITVRMDNLLSAKVDSIIQNMPTANDIENIKIRMSELESSNSIIYILLFISLGLHIILLIYVFNRKYFSETKKSKTNTGKVQSHNKEKVLEVVAVKNTEKPTAEKKRTALQKDTVKVALEPDSKQDVQQTSNSKETKQDAQSVSLPKDAKREVKEKVVKYGTFELLENGDLRTSDRRLTDDASLQWFKIMYDDNSDAATYTINPSKKQEMISDVQTFQYYVEPFSVVGTPHDIKVEKEGKLRRNGKFWTVTEKLKVIFI